MAPGGRGDGAGFLDALQQHHPAPAQKDLPLLLYPEATLDLAPLKFRAFGQSGTPAMIGFLTFHSDIAKEE